MNEKEYIYSRLKFFNDQMGYLTDTVENLTNEVEKQGQVIYDLTAIIKKMQSPEYALQQIKDVEKMEIAKKLAFIQELTKKR